jgi:UDP-N-acetylmuramyl tripeptide synthase
MAAVQGIGDGAALEDGLLVLRRDRTSIPVLPAAEVRIGMGGAARHNLANALAALAGAAALGLPVAAMAETLATFGRDEADNPGRGIHREIGGVRVLVDFAHNPHGVAAIAALVASLPAARRLVLLGQAGDRTDAEIRALAGAVWAMRPDRIVVKEMESYLRGRRRGEVPALLEAELARLGAPPDLVAETGSETEAVRAAFAWAQPGDLLVLFSHAARARTLEFLDRLTATDWHPGESLPGS